MIGEILFLLHLSLALHIPIADLLKWDAWQINLYKTYYSLCPFGYDMDNLRMGIVSATIHNSSGFAETALAPKDFIPDFEEAKEKTTEELEQTATKMINNLLLIQKNKHG